MELFFATQNENKFKEIQSIIPQGIVLKNLNHINISAELPENQDTLEGNALEKARYISENYNKDCFADDTGLEVEALNGRPGVYSARYAGMGKNSSDNIEKLLYELKRETNRKARFRTVIALIINKKEMIFEGIVNGTIIADPRGDEGFGYDPVFVPEGQNKTFAEMALSEKNTMSHRARAFEKLIQFLKGF